jgi:hypothetical protein
MQLHLETDELNLLANLLLERIGKASAQGAASGGQSDESLRLGPQFFDDLLDKILARDLRLDGDELEELGELLSAQRSKLTEQVARPENAARRTELQQKLMLLDRTRERVNEACVMF